MRVSELNDEAVAFMRINRRRKIVKVSLTCTILGTMIFSIVYGLSTKDNIRNYHTPTPNYWKFYGFTDDAEKRNTISEQYVCINGDMYYYSKQIEYGEDKPIELDSYDNAFLDVLNKDINKIERNEPFFIKGPWRKTDSYRDGKGLKEPYRKYYRDIYRVVFKSDTKLDYFDDYEKLLEYLVRNKDASEYFTILSIPGETAVISEEEEKTIDEVGWSLESCDGNIKVKIPTSGHSVNDVLKAVWSFPIGLVAGLVFRGVNAKFNGKRFVDGYGEIDEPEVSEGPEPEEEEKEEFIGPPTVRYYGK